MANASRVKFHYWRKRIFSALEHLWPSRDLARESELLHLRTRKRIPDPSPQIDAAPRAKEIYRLWTDEDDYESIRRLHRPVTIDPEMGIVFSDGRIIWGSSDFPARERSARFLAHILPPTRRLDRAILLHHVFGNNYFHFFCYVVAKAHVAATQRLDPAIPLLVPEKTAATRFFREAMEAGVFRDRTVIIQRKREVIEVGEAYLIRAFDCDRTAFEWAKEPLMHGVEPRPETRLFLVRGARATNARPYRNQDELNAIADNLGFEAYDPAEHSLRDQITQFSGATAIAGAHGAGLTNMMFRPDGQCAIMEIYTPDLASPHYVMMAQQRRFAYRWMMATDPIGKNNVASTIVPPEAFRAGLEELARSG